MPGLINSKAPEIQNPLLRQVEQKIEASVGTGKNREDYLKVVVAGMRAAMGGPKPMLANLKGRPDPVKDCAIGAVNLVVFLRNISKGKMPPLAMVPAAMTLMLQALDFADQAGIVKVGERELDRATHIFVNLMFGALGVSTGTLNRAASLVDGATRDPTQLEALKKMLPQDAAPAGEAPAEPVEEGT